MVGIGTGEGQGGGCWGEGEIEGGDVICKKRRISISLFVDTRLVSIYIYTYILRPVGIFGGGRRGKLGLLRFRC